jgi:hypothetical protein
MKRLAIPGGLYCDALPGGEWVCMMAAPGLPVQTHLGSIPTMDGVNPLFVRCSVKTGKFKFAGQATDTHFGPTAIWQDGAGWGFLPDVPVGLSPVIYDLIGTLQIATADRHVGSNGYRYVDIYTGALVTGDATYSSEQALPPFEGLSEWTDLGDGIFIGQCNVTPGCAVYLQADGTLRMLEPGASQFIRATRYAGSNVVAVAMIQQHGADSVLIWTDLSELWALPIISQPPVPIPPEPPIPPIPVPPIPIPPLPAVGRDTLLDYWFLSDEVSMICTRVISGRQLQAQGGGFNVIVQNPLEADYLGLPPKGTLLPGGPKGTVALSVPPGGDFQCRALNNVGAWDRCTKSGGFLVFKDDDTAEQGHPRYVVPFME